jgi:hypothetical protein
MRTKSSIAEELPTETGVLFFRSARGKTRENDMRIDEMRVGHLTNAVGQGIISPVEFTFQRHLIGCGDSTAAV